MLYDEFSLVDPWGAMTNGTLLIDYNTTSDYSVEIIYFDCLFAFGMQQIIILTNHMVWIYNVCYVS